jgi:hypothetical protein
MVERLADAADGRKIHADRHLVGGCTLERHVKEEKAIDKIRAEKWDVVVLQEQSLRPVVNRQAMHEYARILAEEIRQHGAKPVFYLTWARQHIPEMQEGADPSQSNEYAKAMYQISGAGKTTDFKTWCQQQAVGLQGGLNGSYVDIAHELEAEVAEENPIAATNLNIGVSGPGHSCLTSSPDGTEMFIVYHTHANARKPSGDRVVNIDRIGFDESGKLRITGPTRSHQPMPSGCR